MPSSAFRRQQLQWRESKTNTTTQLIAKLVHMRMGKITAIQKLPDQDREHIFALDAMLRDAKPKGVFIKNSLIFL